ncbi:MAG TPA: tetraacyldisaccharide 4'-kinase [Vicinamibacteria bacterium]
MTAALAERAWLAPLGWAFGAAAAARAAAYRRGLLGRARLRGPVISVGNLSVGGSGKTPLVARLAELLRDAGRAVTVLSRGYGGDFAGEALLVSDGRTVSATAAEAGDEPVMLARELPGVMVVVGRRRDRAGRWAEAHFGPRVFLLDDGFQHLRLERDLDLLCLDASDLAGRPLPAGRLREFPRAAARADLVLLAADGALPAALGAGGLHRWRRRVVGFTDVEGAARPAPRQPFLVAGIARPERFAADVATRVARLAGQAWFRDHHRFTAAEVEACTRRAADAGADALVITAKDAVRWPAVLSSLPVLVLRIAAEIEDEEGLRQRLLAVAP